MIEAKSTQGKSLPFSNIRETQIKCFKNLKKYKEAGIHGMFLIEFSDLKETYMIYSEKILDYIETTDRKSIPVKFLQTEGVRLELQQGKRVRLQIEKGLKGYKNI